MSEKRKHAKPDRLAEALRANLKRRKAAQIRERFGLNPGIPAIVWYHLPG
jgi:hypothetical protein